MKETPLVPAGWTPTLYLFAQAPAEKGTELFNEMPGLGQFEGGRRNARQGTVGLRKPQKSLTAFLDHIHRVFDVFHAATFIHNGAMGDDIADGGTQGKQSEPPSS